MSFGNVGVAALAAASLVFSCGGAENPYDGEYRRLSWNLAPEAASFIAECSEAAKSYRQRADRTHLFCRTQLKYGNERTDYIHNWYERPLYQDSTFGSLDQGNRLVNERSWRMQVHGMRLTKLDGFAAYLSTARRSEILERSLLPGAEAKVLAEFCHIDMAKGLDHCVEFAGNLMPRPNVFQLDGRIVIAGYPHIGGDNLSQKGKFWTDLRNALDQKFGKGKFILMPYMQFWDGGDLDAKELTKEALLRWREHLRGILRHADGGLYFLSGSFFWDKRYNPEFHDNVVIPLLQSVYAEPEFAGKMLAVGATQGHENCYRWSGGIDSTGTRLLRDTLASIERLRPDFVMFCEWDEENENTHFRPLTSNGHVSQRVVRYWADRYARRAPDVFPGDDVTVPNMVVSYRKTLLAGEPLEVEVLGIPDGTARSPEWKVAFRWKSSDGAVVKEWPAKTLGTAEMSAVWFKCPASELLETRILFPELVVSDAGGTMTFGAGMWPLNIEANRNIDFKWVKNALRELPRGVEGCIKVGERRADGSYEVKCKVRGEAKFRCMEVLENFDTAYMHDPAVTNTGKITVRIEMEGVAGARNAPRANGTIALTGEGDARFRSAKSQTGVFVREREVKFRNATVNNWRRSFIVDVSAESLDQTFVEVNVEGMAKRRIALSEIVEKGLVASAEPYGRMIVFERVRTPRSIPPPCNVSCAEFSFDFKPSSPLSILRLRLIDENYRIWHSSDVPQFLEPTGRKIAFHVCERTSDETVRRISLDSSRFVSLDYAFDGMHGDVLYSGPFNDMPFALGGSASLVSGVGRGESGYGNAIGWAGSALCSAPEFAKTAPMRTSGNALAFDGCSYASLPLQAVPVFAGFELEMKIKPCIQKSAVTVFDTGPLGMTFMLNNCVPSVFFSQGGKMGRVGKNRAEGDTIGGPALRANEWNVVRIVFDQVSAFIEVDGVKGEVKPLSGWRYNPRAGGVGTGVEGGVPKSSDGFFHGEIASFKVIPR